MKTGDNKEFWQRTAKSYGPLMKHSGKLYDAICERIRPGLTREMNVLELACGSGQLSFRLAGRVRLWEATDFSENMIVEARKKPRSSRLHFSVQDATALLYAPDSFDARCDLQCPAHHAPPGAGAGGDQAGAEAGRNFVCADLCAWKGCGVPSEGATADPGGVQGLFQMDSGRV